MKLLLTSGGVTNASIRDALVEMLGKPIADSSALCIPTAMYGHPWNGPGEKAWRFISGQQPGNPMVDLGWGSMGVLELTALPSIGVPSVQPPAPRSAPICRDDAGLGQPPYVGIIGGFRLRRRRALAGPLRRTCRARG